MGGTVVGGKEPERVSRAKPVDEQGGAVVGLGAVVVVDVVEVEVDGVDVVEGVEVVDVVEGVEVDGAVVVDVVADPPGPVVDGAVVGVGDEASSPPEQPPTARATMPNNRATRMRRGAIGRLCTAAGPRARAQDPEQRWPRGRGRRRRRTLARSTTLSTPEMPRRALRAQAS
jgi:hypothetical protein